jgi:hypothetical protein
VDARGAAVVGVRAALDEAVALAQAHHGGHGLLGEAGAAGDLTHALPVLLEERDQNGSVGGLDLGEALLGEALL